MGALLFVIASALSLLGLVNAVVANLIYVHGAAVFTGGAWIQLDLSGRTPPHPGSTLADRADWWSAVVQLIGTICFNLSTALALGAAVGRIPAADNGWRPDAIGSAAFLISSWAAAIATTQRQYLWDPLARTWRAMWLNAFGSVAFGVASVLVFPASFVGISFLNSPAAVTWSLVATLIGGIGFFFGGVLAHRTV